MMVPNRLVYAQLCTAVVLGPCTKWTEVAISVPDRAGFYLGKSHLVDPVGLYITNVKNESVPDCCRHTAAKAALLRFAVLLKLTRVLNKPPIKTKFSTAAADV